MIVAGEDILVSDFINESEKNATPANDESRVPKLQNDAKLSRAFIHYSNKSILTAGEAITGATTPQACFIMSAQRLNKYAVIDTAAQSIETEFEMYNTGSSDRRSGLKFNSGAFDFITGLAVWVDQEGGGTHSYLLELFAQNGSGFPTGSALGSKVWTDSDYIETTGAKGAHIYVEFSSPIAVSQSTNYVFVLRETTTNGSSSANFHMYAHSTAANMIYSTNGGSSWSNGNPSDATAGFSSYVIYGYKNLEAGKVYLSDGDDPDRNYFDGFVNQTVSAAASVNLLWGDVAYFTGLLPGTEYYISTTPGTITATAARGKKAGKAQATNVLARSEKPEFSPVYDNDLENASLISLPLKRAYADGIIEIQAEVTVDLTYFISNKFHEALYGVAAKGFSVNGLTNNRHTIAAAIKQNEYIGIGNIISGVPEMYNATTRIRYYL